MVTHHVVITCRAEWFFKVLPDDMAISVTGIIAPNDTDAKTRESLLASHVIEMTLCT